MIEHRLCCTYVEAFQVRIYMPNRHVILEAMDLHCSLANVFFKVYTYMPARPCNSLGVRLHTHSACSASEIRRAPEAWACENSFQSPPPIPSSPSVTSVTSSNPFQSCQHPGIQASGLQIQASRIWNLDIRGLQSAAAGAFTVAQAATGWHKGLTGGRHSGPRTSQIHENP